MKGGIKMSRRIFLWMLIVFLFIVLLYLTFQSASPNAVQGVANAAVSSKTAAASTYGGMVGGC